MESANLTVDWQHDVKNFLQMAQKPLIVVLGPTASGKTGFSIELAHFISDECGLAAEIINADSRQLYRFLNVGTAKITSEDMRGVPHHLLSVLDPKEPVSIAWYQKEAMRTINDIHLRKHIPLLVGGSMLYISSIIDGLLPIDKADKDYRMKLEKEYEVDSGKTLHATLAEIDPESATSIPRENKVYLVRALEIFHLTGQTKSSQKKVLACPYDLLIFGIQKPREEISKCIDQRTKSMLGHGWIKEVQRLLDKGYTADDPGMQSVGYREIIEFLEGTNDRVQSSGREKGLQELEKKIAAKTRQYAKRQMTWWRGDERIKWL